MSEKDVDKCVDISQECDLYWPIKNMIKCTKYFFVCHSKFHVINRFMGKNKIVLKKINK